MRTAQRNVTNKLKQLEKQVQKQKETMDGKDSEIKRLERQLELLGSARQADPQSREDQVVVGLRQKAEAKKGLLMEKEATEQTWVSTIKISQVCLFVALPTERSAY